jgi:hypothetical protein
MASSELGRTPSLDARAYILNASVPLIFHMHDDRRAVLVASTDDSLAGLRRRFAD